jgi:MOSC domain-containing protein YiiM
MEKSIVLSVNIGMPKEEDFFGKKIITSLCKTPVSSPVAVTRFGIIGDGVADKKHHGGEDKALCIYCFDRYVYWERLLGIRLPASAFGENLSIQNIKETEVCIGDRYEIGTTLLEVSQPRQPCATLAQRYGSKEFLKLMTGSGYTGFYCRVIEEGVIKTGDLVILKSKGEGAVTIAYANQIRHHDTKNRDGIKKILAASALSASWRTEFETMLNKCG